jgi:hypothetical protein
MQSYEVLLVNWPLFSENRPIDLAFEWSNFSNRQRHRSKTRQLKAELVTVYQELSACIAEGEKKHKLRAVTSNRMATPVAKPRRVPSSLKTQGQTCH